MSQIENGIKSCLKIPLLYNFFQWGVGATRVRKKIIESLAFPKSNMTLLDIGCGPGTIVPFLPKDVSYYGVDISAKYIDFASRKFSSRSFSCLNVVDCELQQNWPKFDYILALGVLHHLEDFECLKLFSFAKKALAIGGCLLTFDGCYECNQSRLAKYFLDQDRGQNIRSEQGYRALAENSFKNINTTISHSMFRIPYTSIIMKCSL